MEPRSDDTLARLALNLDKQAAGSCRRRAEAELLFLGSDLHDAYAAKKARLREAGPSAASAAQAAQLTTVLKRSLETAPAVRPGAPLPTSLVMLAQQHTRKACGHA